jgi:hypothetical protein
MSEHRNRDCFAGVPGDEVAFAADIVACEGGRIGKETRDCASPFVAPEWRAEWDGIMP